MSDVVAVTIVHGDMESEAEIKSLEAVRNSIEQWWVRTQGTNDTTTYFVQREGLPTMMRTIRAHRRSWWKIQMTKEIVLSLPKDIAMN